MNYCLDDIQKEPGRHGVWNYYNPKNLYLTDEQSKAYLDLMGVETYASKFHDKTTQLIEENVELLIRPFQGLSPLLIDLGPGYPSKTFPIVDAFRKKNSPITYWAVDVSLYFATMAQKAILERGVLNAHAKQMLFEDLADYLRRQKVKDPKLLIIGLTFMNFEPSVIINILKASMSSPRDHCISAIEYSSGEDHQQFMTGYLTENAKKFLFLSLKSLGLQEGDVSYGVDFMNSRVEMYFTILHVPESLKAKGLKTNDRLIAAISYRHSEEKYKTLLSEAFGRNTYFKNGNTMLAVSGI